MPVLTLEVPERSWNDVVMSAIVFGLDMWPDNHGNTGKPTVVELSGSWQKLQQAFNRMKRFGPEFPSLIEVNGALLIQDGG